MAPRDLVSVGVIIGAHGVKGEVKLKSFTADSSAIASYGPLATAAGERLEIARLRPGKDGFIAVLKGVSDRDQAEALKGSGLFVPRERLPEPQQGELYLRDLIGLAVISGGARLGEVIAVHNYGAGDLLDMKLEGRQDTVLIPFAKGFVLSADLEGGRIEVDLPEGFLDETE
jgi:16S rRNA processing protein RimM